MPTAHPRAGSVSRPVQARNRLGGTDHPGDADSRGVELEHQRDRGRSAAAGRSSPGWRRCGRSRRARSRPVSRTTAVVSRCSSPLSRRRLGGRVEDPAVVSKPSNASTMFFSVGMPSSLTTLPWRNTPSVSGLGEVHRAGPQPILGGPEVDVVAVDRQRRADVAHPRTGRHAGDVGHRQELGRACRRDARRTARPTRRSARRQWQRARAGRPSRSRPITAPRVFICRISACEPLGLGALDRRVRSLRRGSDRSVRSPGARRGSAAAGVLPRRLGGTSCAAASQPSRSTGAGRPSVDGVEPRTSLRKGASGANRSCAVVDRLHG